MAKRRTRRRRAAGEDKARGAEQSSAQKGVDYAPKTVEQISTWAEEAAVAHDVALYDVEVVIHGRWIIRVYIDLPGPLDLEKSVNAGQCAQVSRYLEAYLDAADEIPQNYVLEVSSPGIERELKKPAHLRQALGHQIQLVVRKQVEGKNKVFGELVAYQDDVLSVLLDEGSDSPVDIHWADIKEARLRYDFDF